MEQYQKISNDGCFLVVMALIVLVSPCLCEGYVFVVGGKNGWVTKPAESYTHWSGRNRFQVNDTLLFKYPKGNDSVLVVTRENYASCNAANPIQSLADGNSLFTFDRSGPFFFISGNRSSCNGGQKLLVVVLAVRPKAPSPPSTVTPPQPQVQPPKAAEAPSQPGSAQSPTSSTLDIQAPAPATSSAVAGSVGGAVMAVSALISVAIMFV